MAGAGGEFVEGWLVAQVLGEGAYGEVRLLVHARSGARVALKAVGGEGGAREAALHRALRHAHVLRCLGARAHRDHHYLFLEYAAGGELFERIEPDIGMPPSAARRYWRQLAAGLRYLHARGVAHRDIKPENLLLDHKDNIKISDFGMATLFRHGSRERLLSRVCGTVPYAAPEVLSAPQRPYRAPPADVWPAAVVLVAMLAGELPWERAAPSDARFVAWSRWVETGAEASAEAPGGPWARLGAGARGWLRRALHPRAEMRAPLADLLLDRWMADTPLQAGARGCLSQPAGGAGRDEADAGEGEVALSGAVMDALLSCSQPASADDLLLSSQLSPLHHAPADADSSLSAGAGAGPLRRLARVRVRGAAADALRALAGALARAGCSAKRLDASTLAVSCPPDLRMRAWRYRIHEANHSVKPFQCNVKVKDNYNISIPKYLSTSVHPLKLDGKLLIVVASDADATLIQFRRWRGCGLAFQRRFLDVRAALAAHLAPAPADGAAPPGASDTVQPMDEDHAT